MEVLMKFIFPKNYDFKNKILGVIDYPTAIFNVIVFFIIFFFTKLLVRKLSIKLFFIIIFYLPVFLFSILGSQNESVVFIIFYIIKYFLKPKIYLYK